MNNIYKATALDLTQTTYMDDNMMSIIYCNIYLDEIIDINRLHDAVRLTAQTVPQILCVYNCEKHGFVTADFSTNEIINVFDGEFKDENSIWDLTSGPQIKINIYRDENKDLVQFCMSHILADGAGLLDYLYLLCNCYNNSQTTKAVNKRNLPVSLLLNAVLHRCNRFKSIPLDDPLFVVPLDDSSNRFPTSLKAALTEEQLKKLILTSKGLGVTLNDYFMAAYAHAVKCLFPDYKGYIDIPCTANLRAYNKHFGELSISNMTGKFYCPISLSEDFEINDVSLSFHDMMIERKESYACFKWIPTLASLHALLPSSFLRSKVKQGYSMKPIEYTNVGRIDEDKLIFIGLNITDCFISAPYRPAESFQVCISTYNNKCTFASNMLCTQKQKEASERILNQIISGLVNV